MSLINRSKHWYFYLHLHTLLGDSGGLAVLTWVQSSSLAPRPLPPKNRQFFRSLLGCLLTFCSKGRCVGPVVRGPSPEAQGSAVPFPACLLGSSFTACPPTALLKLVFHDFSFCQPFQDPVSSNVPPCPCHWLTEQRTYSSFSFWAFCCNQVLFLTNYLVPSFFVFFSFFFFSPKVSASAFI